MSEDFSDYEIELKGRPKLDITQPDSETTTILKEFRNFQLDGKNFEKFKAQLDTWYAAKISSLNEQIYELAEQLKDFPEIDETNFQFADRNALTKEQKMELVARLPIFTEDWRAKLSLLMRMMSKAFTNSIFLIDILWDANKKMSAYLVGNPVGTQIQVQVPVPRLVTPRAVNKIIANEYLKIGAKPSDIAREYESLGVTGRNVAVKGCLGIAEMINNGEMTLDTVREKRPEIIRTVEKFVKRNSHNVMEKPPMQ